MTHPLFVAFMGALFGVVLGGLGTWLSLENKPPVAEIVPSSQALKANENIAFDASGSIDPEGEALTFTWTVGAENPTSTHLAACDLPGENRLLNCRFVMPGAHIVSVSVKDPDGASDTASSSIRIEMPGGYIGFVLQFGNRDRSPDFVRAFLYAVDWPAVQALLPGRLIVLFDPDRGQPVYAANVIQSLEKAREFADRAGGIGGVRLLIPGVPNAVRDKIMVDLAAAGIAVIFTPIAAGEIATALGTGLSDAAFVLLASSEELIKFYE